MAVSRGDLDAIAAIQRIAVKKITERQYLTQEPVISTQESTTLPRGEGREASETEIQREKEHQQNLGQYRQSFFQAVEQEFPLSEGSRRQLRNLQQSLQLTDEEISQIEQPIFDQKEAERLRQQQEADRLEQQKAERIRQQQGTTIAPSTPITRKQFLKWSGLGGAALVTAVVAREIFKQQPPSISVAEPKHISPTEGAPKAFGLPLWTVEFETRFVFLPDDYYDIIAAYMLIPSALAKVVPYLFLYGQSGTGKSTLGKLISYFWGVPINTSGDTYASIRNSLNDRKYQDIEIPSKDPSFPSIYKKVEVNTGMVWDDIDSSVVLNTPYFFRMLKVGYDSSTDKISISSDIKGENLEFRCFSLKVFSSISPIHLEDSLKELQRRLIVIPFKRIEDVSDERLAQLGTTKDTWPKHLLNINAFDWKGFSSLFTNFWNRELAEVYLLNRKTLMNTLTGLSSKERAISLDLLSAGIASGIWKDEIQGVARLKNYFDWFEREINQFSGTSKYLKDYISLEQKHAECEITLDKGQFRIATK